MKTLKTAIKEEIYNILKEDEERGPSKATHHHLGLKLERIVIEGPDVKKHQNDILALAKKHDPDSKLQFYPATGKIIGIVSKVKIEFLIRDLKSIDKSLKLIIKPQSASLIKK